MIRTIGGVAAGTAGTVAVLSVFIIALLIY
jgi:hypothetical protein